MSLRTAAKRPATSLMPAVRLPVARVLVDVPLPHLDHPFDYLVPATLDERVVPGCRVRVRFAGRLVDGYVLDRAEEGETTRRLAFLQRCVSSEPVLTDELAGLARAVADRYAGSLADVLRLAIPPRHAAAEAALVAADPAGRPAAGWPEPPAGAGRWAWLAGGLGFLAELAAGRAPRAVWRALPGDEPAGAGPGWAGDIALAAQQVLAAGRGVLVVAPAGREVDAVGSAIARAVGPQRVVLLTAELGPAERYRRWLALRRGLVRCAVGTRAAAFAPVRDIGLLVLWDDGDDLLAEPRAPYPHAREVLLLRAERGGHAALLGGFGHTCEAELLLRTGWARPLVAERPVVRRHVPLIRATGDDDELARDPGARAARLPSLAWTVVHDALGAGRSVLVQVARAGYQPSLQCDRCRRPARCPRCSGPLSGRPRQLPACGWCGAPAADWRCPECQGQRLRAGAVGVQRTAEELGRAFPGARMLVSGGDHVLTAAPTGPAVVVATPGAEPAVPGGYGAGLLLDGALMLGRADLRAGEETLRRWLAAAALVRPGSDGGRVVVVADAALPPVQALMRWDPGWYAARELADRAALGFPPAVRMAELTGPPDAVGELLAAAELPPDAQVHGPVPVEVQSHRPVPTDPEVRALVRAPRRAGAGLAAALKAAAASRAARKAVPVRVRVDPVALG